MCGIGVGHAKVGYCVFGTHKSGHLCMCGDGFGICIACHCECVVLGLGHAKVGFCVFGTHKSGHLCMCGVEVGICIVCHCVCVVLELGHAKVGFCVKPSSFFQLYQICLDILWALLQY